MENELLYQIALTRIPHIGPVHAKNLVEKFGSAKAIFQAPATQLEKIEGIGSLRAKSIKSFHAFADCEKEIAFIEKFGIRTVFYSSPDYPSNLRNCYDPPPLLFFKGNISLNHHYFVGIVGTRSNTGYGMQVTQHIIEGLAKENIVVVSGLAKGIDAVAHKAALEMNVPTLGVLAHGLDTIYPANHHQLARAMLGNGGLITEFPSKTMAEKHHFPNRNRIVAGICDVIIVVETGVKGGSMITADLAYQYNREVYAVPGRLTDKQSSGCHRLIWEKKAAVFSSVENFLEDMGWKKPSPPVSGLPTLFPDLTGEEKKVLEVIKEKQPVHIDEIRYYSGLTGSKLNAVLLQLEIKALVSSLPGSRYAIL